jgi:hypothetical protein
MLLQKRGAEREYSLYHYTEVTEKWRKQDNGELDNLYASTLFCKGNYAKEVKQGRNTQNTQDRKELNSKF